MAQGVARVGAGHHRTRQRRRGGEGGRLSGARSRDIGPTQADKARLRRRQPAAGLKPYDDKERAARVEWAAAALGIATTPATSGAGIAVKYALFKKKYDGYRMHARLVRGEVRLLTRTGLDWTDRYEATAKAISVQKLAGLPLLERKERLKVLVEGAPRSIQYSDHHIGDGPRFLQAGCGAKAEGIVSKRVDAPYVPGDRGVWRKAKCYQREEFVIVGYSEPEGSRAHIGALLLAYYDDAGQLVYAGRVGTGFRAASCPAWRLP
jgi:hypothetical protein